MSTSRKNIMCKVKKMIDGFASFFLLNFIDFYFTILYVLLNSFSFLNKGIIK